MNGLTREDMLRELELLPVWKLRQPLPDPVPAATAEVALQASNAPSLPVPSEHAVETAAVLEAQLEIAAASAWSKPVRALLSDDTKYMFLMQPALPDEAAALLLQNMLRAMRMTCRTETQGTVDEIFAQHTPKLIICFGSETAETLLQETHTMAEWRSQQPHSFRDTPLVVTFSPEHLLQHHQDKALAWQDLCLAMQLMQTL